MGWVWCRGRRRCLLCRPGRRGTWRHRRAFCVAGMALIVLGWLRWRAWVGFGTVVAAAVCVAGMALGDIDRHFAWQVWYLATWTCILRGRRGTYRAGLAPVVRLGWVWRWVAAAVGVAAVALGDIELHFACAGLAPVALGLGLAPWSPPPFAWQAWRLATSIVTLRGRCGTWRHQHAFCVAGVALIVLGWLRWRAWVGFGAVVAATVCVAGMALGDIDRHFAWQVWYLRHGRAFCVAGMAFIVLGWLRWRAGLAPWSPPPFAWQAWQAWRHGHAFCVAGVALIVLGWLRWRAWVGFRAVVAAAVGVEGVALGDIELHFACQAWYLWQHGRAFCVAGMALIILGWLRWRAWVWRCGRCRRLRGRRGTWRHRSSLCVPGVVLGDMDVHSAWQAWHLSCWAGSGVGFGAVVAAAVGVAGVALGDIDRHFAWQAWYLATSTCILRGRRGTYRTGLAPVVRLGWVWWSPPPFAWQAWHLATSIATLRGRCGTWRHGRAFCVAGVALIVLGWLRWRAWVFGAVVAAAVCVAGVALGDIDRHFAWLATSMHSAWQAWHLTYWAGSGGALGFLAPWSPPPFAWQAWHLATSIVTLRGWRQRCTYRTGLAPVARLGWVWRRFVVPPFSKYIHTYIKLHYIT